MKYTPLLPVHILMIYRKYKYFKIILQLFDLNYRIKLTFSLIFIHYLIFVSHSANAKVESRLGT